MFNNTIIRKLAHTIKINHFKRKWRKINKENETLPINIFPLDIVLVKKKTYGELNIVTFNNKSHLEIGSYCSIAQHVTFILDAEHQVNTISTYPFKVKCMKTGNEAFSKGNIIIDDDVWIGYGATIMSGVHIGQGAIVAAGSIVTRSVPPYAIVGGVPAKIIKYRFESKLIKELLKIDYNKLTDEMIRKHISDLYVTLKDESQLKWMPKKENGD